MMNVDQKIYLQPRGWRNPYPKQEVSGSVDYLYNGIFAIEPATGKVVD